MYKKTDWEYLSYRPNASVMNNMENHIYEGVNQSKQSYDESLSLINRANVLLGRLEEQNNLISDLDSELTSIKNKANQVLERWRNLPLFTFMDDDCSVDFLELSKPVYDENNIKCSLSVPIDAINMEGTMTTSDLLSLKKEGYDLLNHIKGGYTLSPTNAAALVTRCKQFAIDAGYFDKDSVNADIIVYPNANIDADPQAVEKECGKHIKYALNVGGGVIYDGFNKLDIHRSYLCKDTGVGTWLEDVIKQGIGYKYEWVDEYDDDGVWTGGHMEWIYHEEAEKGWVVIFTHSWMHDEDKFGGGVFDLGKLREMVGFVKGLGYNIVTVSKALLIKFGIS